MIRKIYLYTGLAFLIAACGSQVEVKHPNLDLSDAPRLGPEDAPTEVIVFSDFQCPFCRKAAAELNRVHEARPAAVKIYFKHYPLQSHPQAENAARAAEAARRQGKFWAMHDLLFAYSGSLRDDIYPDLAQKIGLDVRRFSSDYEAAETRNRVLADRAQGDAASVEYTPFFIVDGQVFSGSYRKLARQLLDAEE